MVFQVEATFRQYVHCKFKENVVRVLYIPKCSDVGEVFLVVTKWGSVALYHPHNMGLIHTFSLNLSGQTTPRCEKAHVVIDAVYAGDIRTLIFATSKRILMCYDVGELAEQNLGLDILPRGEFMSLKKGECPVPLRNVGLVETHRILGLDNVPSCLTYHPSTSNKEGKKEINGKLLIGDVEGGIAILHIVDKAAPFLGRRKLRGTLVEVRFKDLRRAGMIRSYRGHDHPVEQVGFVGGRNLIVSASRDKKFSLFCEDYGETCDPFIISLAKGVNSVAFSDTMNMIVTGSGDGVVRIFSQFSMKMPQTELSGHRAPVVSVQLLSVPFSETQIILSYSEDVELRAWDAVSFLCLQHLYLRFPPANLSSTIICKTPQFGKQPLLIYQPDFLPKGQAEGSQPPPQNGFILLLFCNSYVKLELERDETFWPFNYSMDFFPKKNVSKKMLEKKSEKNPHALKLSGEEEAAVEQGAPAIKDHLLQIKARIRGKSSEGSNGLAATATKTFCSMDTRTRMRTGVFDKLPFYHLQHIRTPSHQPKPYL